MRGVGNLRAGHDGSDRDQNHDPYRPRRLHVALIAFAQNRFNGLHDWSRWTCDAIVHHLIDVFLKTLDVNNRVAALTVIVAAQPKRDVSGVRNLITSKLFAGNFRYIKSHLALRRGHDKAAERQTHSNL